MSSQPCGRAARPGRRSAGRRRRRERGPGRGVGEVERRRRRSRAARAARDLAGRAGGRRRRRPRGPAGRAGAGGSRRSTRHPPGLARRNCAMLATSPFCAGSTWAGRRVTNEELRAAFEGARLRRTSRPSAPAATSSSRPRRGRGRRTSPTEIEAGWRGARLRGRRSSCAPASRSRRSPPASRSTRSAVEASAGKLQVALLPDAPGKPARKEALGAGHRRGPARDRGRRALLAAERRHQRIRPRPEDARGGARALDDADDGHDRADRRQALRLEARGRRGAGPRPRCRR